MLFAITARLLQDRLVILTYRIRFFIAVFQLANSCFMIVMPLVAGETRCPDRL